MKKLYLITILLIFIGCGGSSNSSSSIPTVDNNQSVIETNNTTDNNQPIIETNVTTDNNQPIIETNITTDNNQPIIETNNTTDNNQPVIDNNITTDNNQPIIETNITTDNNQPVIETNITTDNNQPIIDNKLFGKAQLGVLSKATVKLYELNKIEKKLLAKEVTTSGESIEDIGNFNLYLEKLEDEKFYLYEISGGQDYDVNDDGIIDNTPTPNKGIFHLLVKGAHIKAIKKATISVVSEIIYQKLLSSLSLENSNIESKMEALGILQK